jgi:hypothetical protein
MKTVDALFFWCSCGFQIHSWIGFAGGRIFVSNEEDEFLESSPEELIRKIKLKIFE